MNKDELIKIINALVDARVKKIIREEIQKTETKLKKELVEHLKTPNLQLDSDTFDLKSLFDGGDSGSSKKAKAQEKITPKTYSNDPKINAILQQTAEELKTPTNKAAIDEYKKILSEEYNPADLMQTFNFNSSDMNSIANKQITPEIEGKVALEVAKQLVEEQTGNAEIAQAIFRDYRSLMKKVDEKSKAKRPGV